MYGECVASIRKELNTVAYVAVTTDSYLLVDVTQLNLTFPRTRTELEDYVNKFNKNSNRTEPKHRGFFPISTHHHWILSYVVQSTTHSAKYNIPRCRLQLCLVWSLCSPFNFSTIFTVRRYALHGICYSNYVRPSVRPSVCLSHSWTVSTWFDLRSWFLHHMVAPSF